MKNLTNVVAQHFIIHITEQEDMPFVPSSALTPLSNGVRDYVEKHLRDALGASKTFAASFVNPDADRPAKLCRHMISDADTFLTGSALLAERLLEVTRGSGRITKGNLAFVQFKADIQVIEELTQTFQFLAIMKLDVGDAFVTTFDPDTGVAELKKQGSAAPTNKEGLQKCAFISLERWDGDDGYDLMLLDKQGDDGIARFWAESFLDAKAALDDGQRWRLFKKKAKEAIENVTGRFFLSEAENRTLTYAVHDALNRSHIDVREWARDLPVAEEAKEEIESILARKLTDLDFSPPPELRDKDVIEFRGDNDIILKIPAKDLNFLDEEPIEREGQTYTQITFITKKWKSK